MGVAAGPHACPRPAYASHSYCLAARRFRCSSGTHVRWALPEALVYRGEQERHPHVCGYSALMDVAALRQGVPSVRPNTPSSSELHGRSSVANLIASRESAGGVGSDNSNKELAMPVVLIHHGPTVT